MKHFRMQTLITLLVIAIASLGLWLAMGQIKNDQIAAYELSISAMEQHVYIRDARAAEQKILINLLIKEHNDLIKELNGNDEQS